MKSEGMREVIENCLDGDDKVEEWRWAGDRLVIDIDHEAAAPIKAVSQEILALRGVSVVRHELGTGCSRLTLEVDL